MSFRLQKVIPEEKKMLSIFADALLIAARQPLPPRPSKERPYDQESDVAWRRFWLNNAQSNR
jgi:hypothetical protein